MAVALCTQPVVGPSKLKAFVAEKNHRLALFQTKHCSWRQRTSIFGCLDQISSPVMTVLLKCLSHPQKPQVCFYSVIDNPWRNACSL